MDYEKKYKDALERAKEIKSKILLSHLSTESCKAVSEYIDTIIPELAESEDERIRKTLIEELSACETVGELKFRLPQPTRDEVLAWLEKQKEPKNTSASTMIPSCWAEEPSLQKEPKPWRVGANAYFTPEQKPAEWKPTEEQFNYLAKAIMTLGEEGDCKTAGVLSEIRKGLKCSFPDWKVSPDYPEEGCNVSLNGEVKKIQEWSEEEQKVLDEACCWLYEYAGSLMQRNYGKSSTLYGIANKLKSLRSQSQGTYKQIIHNIYNMLKDKDFFEIRPPHLVSLLNDIRVKCKDADECATILDEPSWKPSEEQMSMLLAVIRDPNNAGSESCHLALESLLEDLNKLM